MTKRLVLVLVLVCLARTVSAQKAYQDTFTRASATLTGSTSSDGLFTWSVPDGPAPSTNGTAIFTSGTAGFTAIASADTDTDAIYIEWDLSAFTNAPALWLDLSSNGTYPGAGSNGYEFAMFGGNALIFKIASGAFTQLATAAHTLAIGTYRAERNGSALALYRNGVLVVSATDSSEPTGAGNRRAGGGADATGSSVTLAEFRYGDIGGGPPPCKPTMTLLGVGRCG